MGLMRYCKTSRGVAIYKFDLSRKSRVKPLSPATTDNQKFHLSLNSQLLSVQSAAPTQDQSCSIFKNKGFKVRGHMSNKWSSFLEERSKRNVNEQWTIYTVWLCLYVVDPATSLDSNNVLGPFFPLRTVCLFTYGQNTYFWDCINLLLV